MSKNYDMIATVDIDIANPIVDETSFDNFLIMGPGPKSGNTAPDVGVYASLEEVLEAGYVASGENADPVGVAAQVAFSQSPRPTAVYIAVQKPTANALAAQKVIETMTSALETHTAAYEKKGCSVAVDYDARRITVTLQVPFAQADGHGLFQALDEFVKKGNTATIDDITVEKYVDFKKTPYDAQLLAMKKGDAPITFQMKMIGEDGVAVTYVITVAFPGEETVTALSDGELEPVDSPEKELEEATATVARALNTSGWYVLCTAGVDSADYPAIAAFVETQEKMFCYTDLGYFEDGPVVDDIYFRTMGIFGKETPFQTEVPEANKYLNVAWVAKWLSYDAGSETAAFKQLAAVYPSELSMNEMKTLESDDMNYFVEVGNRNISMNGKTRGGEWADIIRFRDWLKNDMQLRVVNLFVVRPKVPYTDSGIALVQNQMIASLREGQANGGIAEDEFDGNGTRIPGYLTSVPRASSISAAEKATRKLYKCRFKARLAGAIHFAELKGSLTYEL